MSAPSLGFCCYNFTLNHQSSRTKNGCGGLNENSLCRLIDLNASSPVVELFEKDCEVWLVLMDRI